MPTLLNQYEDDISSAKYRSIGAPLNRSWLYIQISYGENFQSSVEYKMNSCQKNDLRQQLFSVSSGSIAPEKSTDSVYNLAQGGPTLTRSTAFLGGLCCAKTAQITPTKDLELRILFNSCHHFRLHLSTKLHLNENINPLGTESTCFLGALRPERAEESCWPGLYISW